VADRDQLNAVVDAIYDASLDPSRWHHALAGLAAAVQGAGAYLYTVAADLSIPFSINSGLPESMEREYSAYYVQHCPRLGYILRHPETEIIYDYMIMSDKEMNHHEYYAWVASHGFRYMIGSRLYQDPGEQVFIGVQRTKKAGHVSDSIIKRYTLLTGHLSRAIKISKELGYLKHRVTALEALTDASVYGTLFLDAGGRIIYRNRAAKAALDAGDGLREHEGLLAADGALEQQSLTALIAQALADQEELREQWHDTVKVARRSGRHAYLVRAVPLRGERFSELRGQARVAVFITDPDTNLGGMGPVAARAFGLTPTESRIAAGLADGKSLAHIANQLDVTERTARLHLEHIFHKTGTHKQHELVRLVLLATLGAAQL
jgi:DNA-binding CsgD family transcriptional regulator